MKKEKPVLTYRFDHDTLFSAILAAHHEYNRMTGDFSLLVSGRFVRGDEEHNHHRGLQNHPQGRTCAFFLPERV
jgi:hypothetical protein